MKEKIIYYLGAGASADAIPILKGMRKNIKKASDFLMNTPFVEGKVGDIKRLDERRIILGNDLNWLYKESENHSTIDTLARKYYLQANGKESDNLIRLKRTSILYFAIEQFIRYSEPNYEILGLNEALIKLKMDLRYDSLIAVLAKEIKGGKIHLENKVSIILWNYDIQFELALKSYFNNNLHELRRIQNILPNHLHYKGGDGFNVEKFSLIKLNGSAIMDENIFNYEKMGSETFYDKYFPIEDRDVNTFISDLIKFYDRAFWTENYKNIKTGIIESLKFSWEEEHYLPAPFGNIVSTMINNSKSLVNNAKVLIVIGYSFPYFNRDVDLAILSEAAPEKIVIVDFEPERIKQRLLNYLPKLRDSNPEGNRYSIVLLQPSEYFYVEEDF